MNRRLRILIALALAWQAHPAGYGQAPGSSNPSYELYLTQIAAAEAYLQLNLISTANGYLNQCEPTFRDLEWHFLNAALDQSAATIPSSGGITFSNVKCSPSGNLLAVSGSDSTITLVSYPGLQPVRTLRGHSGAVSTLDFSRDGRKLASGGRDHAVIIWDVASGAQLSKNDTSFSQGIYQVRFHPGDAQLGVVSWERIPDRPPGIFGFAKLLDVETGRELKRFELDNHPASGVVFTPDGRHMLLASWGEIAYSYDLENGRQDWVYDLSDSEEYNAFHSIGISPDGTLLALGSTDHRVHLLDTKDGSIKHRIEPWQGHTKTVKATVFSPDGQWLATAGEDQTILVWETASFTRKQALIGHTNTVGGLAWAAGTKALLSASLDGTARLWDLDSPFEARYAVCDYGPWQTPLTANGQAFAAPCSDNKLQLYRAADGEVVTAFGEQSGLCGDISRDGKKLATASFDGVVRVWDMATGAELHAFSGHTKRVDGVAYLNKANQVISVGDTTLRVWDMASGTAAHTLSFDSPPFRITVTPDETRALVGFGDGSVQVIDTRTWKTTHSFAGGNSGLQEMQVSPDGRLLALFCANTIELWDTSSYTLHQTLEGHEKSGYGLGFSPDSRYLVSGAYDQTFKLWNLQTGRCTLTFHGSEEDVYSSKFLSGRELLFSSGEGMVRYYKF